MKKALENGAHIQERAPNHWICYIDCSKVKQDEIGYQFHVIQHFLQI
jgi:hypothetical protein